MRHARHIAFRNLPATIWDISDRSVAARRWLQDISSWQRARLWIQSVPVYRPGISTDKLMAVPPDFVLRDSRDSWTLGGYLLFDGPTRGHSHLKRLSTER